ncbi:MAG: flagellar hook-length control protein FliK, partial [Campylobacterales bacterium]|nr:flagellar hook-length control protein FliK [Campylobacterales bacterium]
EEPVRNLKAPSKEKEPELKTEKQEIKVETPKVEVNSEKIEEPVKDVKTPTKDKESFENVEKEELKTNTKESDRKVESGYQSSIKQSKIKQSEPITLETILNNFDKKDAPKINDIAKKFFQDEIIEQPKQSPEKAQVQNNIKESVKAVNQSKIDLSSILRSNSKTDSKGDIKTKEAPRTLGFETKLSQNLNQDFTNEVLTIKSGGLKQPTSLNIGSQNAISNNSPIINEEKQVTELPKIEETNIKSEATNKNEINHSKKETISSFAQSLKQQVEEYRPPIMKVALSLTPKNLGQVDVTIKQRGGKIEVNLTSNNQALQIFTQGSFDLKTALANIGFNEVNMNLNDSGSKDGQKREQEQNEKEEESNEDELEITMEREEA